MAAKKPKSKSAAHKGKAKSARKTFKKTAKKSANKVTKKAAKKVVKKAATNKTAAKKKVAKKAKNAAVKKKTVKQAAPKRKVPSKAKQKVAKKAPKKAVNKAPAKSSSAPVKKAANKVTKKAAPKKPATPTRKLVKSSHTAAFVKKQRQRLLDLRDELLDAMSGMTRDTIRNAPEGSEASGSGQHQGDAGSDAYDRDFALSVLAKEQDALYEIEQALYRIDKGNYGMCEISFEKIPQMRLEAIPFARLTVACQAQWEQEYGNRRFRPSDEVGFSGGNQLDEEDSASVSLDDDN